MKLTKELNKDYGFYKVAAATFPIHLGNPLANADEIVKLIKEATDNDIQLLVLPELCLTGYTCADMFLRKELYEQAIQALLNVKAATHGNRVLVCVGMPIEEHGKLFNCAVYIQSGDIKGVVPKTYIPNYGEFYEKRWFVSSSCRTADKIKLCGSMVPFSEKLLLKDDISDVAIATEICEDLWVDSPPSGLLSRAGATIIINPSASNELVGKRDYRRNLVAMQSGRCRAGYVYASSGVGESSTDLVFSGHCMIAENGKILNEGTNEMVVGVIDVEKCVNDRRKYNSDVWVGAPEITENTIFVSKFPPTLPDKVNAYPFIPKDKTKRADRCREILNLQAEGLAQRLRATKIEHMILGLSGGLDSTLALIVCTEAAKKLGICNKNIHCISMPGFGTSDKTFGLTQKIAKAFGTDFDVVDISEACRVHLKDLKHADDVYDIAYENTQARERTQVLFDKANMLNGLVIGTGDMSELALGWCTYNGDHMSNYAVNCSVPKTLVKYIVEEYSNITDNKEVKETLREVLNLPISPELIPTDENGEIKQKTEETLGKYDLHDFFLYNFLRNGFSRDKIQVLAEIAFEGIASREEIAKALDVFFTRFRTNQFKRSCIPDGPKVGSVSLSPRGDLRLPSDLEMLY